MAMTTEEMLARLVGFDTTSSKSNLALIDFVEGYLQGLGARTRRSAEPGKEKANLVASLGPEVAGGVVLSGHSDVVPVTGQAWSSDPFALEERGGRLYGRGTCDMKGFIATALALAPAMRDADLKRPIHFALSYDEEIGCFGARPLIEDLMASLPRPAAVIVGEPTEMRLMDGHKGIRVYRTTVTGSAAHSSQTHKGVNAIALAARLIAHLEEVGAARRAGPADRRYEPPWTSLSVGTIAGGEAQNIIPARCSFTWEIRPIPEDPAGEVLPDFETLAEELLDEARKVTAEADIVTEPLAEVPGLKPDPGNAAEELVRRLTGRNDSEGAAFATEAGLFQQAGLPTVICGPGSVAQAHQPDEFVALSELRACEDFLKKLIAWASE